MIKNPEFQNKLKKSLYLPASIDVLNVSIFLIWTMIIDPDGESLSQINALYLMVGGFTLTSTYSFFQYKKLKKEFSDKK